ncbi:flagellar hook-basal body complex protein FliE [Aquibacillus koreensis]|uniref:Flagellar hook-basal body complex protein FliE n=2 Tax=Aquibacillus koreensis TaxID=279446 RepID=A0A9X3WNA5_9BACI|nr:flagellar hook-basal body complex protein FliE [Aquibacillus koreensis]MCT2534518.1 flagellar hook-basal body complex protein FliE [Aquibacillus koreensis]MDC3421888.1 flagellar hook-basal body complex protein FliE [Aquibacillus koreensis]
MLGTQTRKTSVAEAQQNFSQSLKGAIEKLNEVQMHSDKQTEALAKGEITDLHDVMIASQKSSVALQTAVEIQRKAIDAYNEIMRMQV